MPQDKSLSIISSEPEPAKPKLTIVESKPIQFGHEGYMSPYKGFIAPVDEFLSRGVDAGVSGIERMGKGGAENILGGASDAFRGFGPLVGGPLALSNPLMALRFLPGAMLGGLFGGTVAQGLNAPEGVQHAAEDLGGLLGGGYSNMRLAPFQDAIASRFLPKIEPPRTIPPPPVTYRSEPSRPTMAPPPITFKAPPSEPPVVAPPPVTFKPLEGAKPPVAPPPVTFRSPEPGQKVVPPPPIRFKTATPEEPGVPAPEPRALPAVNPTDIDPDYLQGVAAKATDIAKARAAKAKAIAGFMKTAGRDPNTVMDPRMQAQIAKDAGYRRGVSPETWMHILREYGRL